jgi:hypothetical protein
MDDARSDEIDHPLLHCRIVKLQPEIDDRVVVKLARSIVTVGRETEIGAITGDFVGTADTVGPRAAIEQR